MRIIQSRTNQEIQQVHALQQTKYRAQAQQFIAEGVRVCETLLHSNIQLVTLYTTEALLPEAQKLLVSAHSSTRSQSDRSHQIVLVSNHVMEKISTATTPSGILGVFRIPPQPTPDQLTPGLVLAHIADSGNMGTLIRSAAAVGTKSVVIVEGVDPWSPKVVQATAGTIGAISLFSWSWEQLITHKQNLHLYGLVVSGGYAVENIKRDKALLVIGNESHGLSSSQLASCDHRITLPMPGNTESLNAAIAGSIALYITFVQR